MKVYALILSLICCVFHGLKANEILKSSDSIIPSKSQCAVLGYHDFSGTLPVTEMRMKTSEFRKQLQIIHDKGLPVITLKAFLDWKNGKGEIPDHSILITLDDGWKSVYTDAFPILKEYNYPFTLFLYKNYIDGGGKALTKAMIREMQAAGAEIASHSVSHPYPSDVREAYNKGADSFRAFLQLQFGESKRFLERQFSTSIQAYAYPGGFHLPEMDAVSQALGYQALFTVIPGKVTQESIHTKLPRYMILGTHPQIFHEAVCFDSRVHNPISGNLDSSRNQSLATEPELILKTNPMQDSVINDRLPKISIDFSTLAQEIDIKTLKMNISTLGNVPAIFDEQQKVYSWVPDLKLRQPLYKVKVEWKNTQTPSSHYIYEWIFKIDLISEYLK